MSLLPPEVLARYRAEFPITETHAFLNHAGVAPTSTRVVGEVNRWMEKLAHLGRPSFEEWEAEAQACRESFARLVGAAPEEIAFIRNTSHGLSLIASGLDWRPGDRVAVAVSEEYPSNVYPWEDLSRRGIASVDAIDVRNGAVHVDAVERAMRRDTRLVSVSSAQYGSGAVTDLEAVGRLCRDRDVLLCVDGIQTVGALPLDVKAAGIHALSADSHKWMLGMMGIGAMYIDRDLLESVHPPLLGWSSMVDGWDFDHAHFELLPDAGRYEEGSLPYPLIAGFAAALELLHEVTVEAVSTHVGELVHLLSEGLERVGCEVAPEAGYRRHMLTFRHPTVDPVALEEALAREDVVASVRRGSVRLSPHFYNTADEMAVVVGIVEQAVSDA